MRVLLGVGGSATTDGGLGAIEALGWTLPLPLAVACDVGTALEAARVFGPQRGLRRGRGDAHRSARRACVHVSRPRGTTSPRLAGSGAAGGTAGGLAALGAGFARASPSWRRRSALAATVRPRGVVVTGEGRLDQTSLAGKVVGEVLRAAPQPTRAAVVAGEVVDDVVAGLPGSPRVVSLAELAGSVEAAQRRTPRLVRRAVGSSAWPRDARFGTGTRARENRARLEGPLSGDRVREEGAREMRRRRLGAVAVLLAAGAAALALAASSAGQTEPFKAAWIYVGPHNDNGWSQSRQGRRGPAGLGREVKTTYKELVPEGPQTCQVIEPDPRRQQDDFATSFGFQAYVVSSAKKHPDVLFEMATGTAQLKNLAEYFSAGETRSTFRDGGRRGDKKGVIGYIVPFPIPR